MTKPDYKIAVVGYSGAGKASIVLQFVHGIYSMEYNPTVVDSYRHAIDIDQDHFDLEISHLAPHEEYEPLVTPYVKESDGFIIVYSVDNRSSFAEVELFHDKVVSVKGVEDIPLVICGNKCDLENKRDLSKEEGEKLAERFNAKFFETSAVTKVNIEETFRTIVREIQRKLGSNGTDSKTRKKGRKGGRGECAVL